MNSKELREAFFNFFKSKHHQIVSSAPMIIKNDPTLMFTNAGMNQFKDIFLGHQAAEYKRVANTQKCLRVSGKHNDLEEVGHDTYHHTMFEMLGNWSFGDYFKKEAIEWGWEFLTSALNIPADRIYVTVFEGNKDEDIERDDESAGYWGKCFNDPENRIINGSKKDNFWEMGDTGPCGPCSEIHIDMRSDNERAATPGHQLVNKDHPLVIEIWNLVFIQYNRKQDGALELLPQKHVDTGMGFERLCMVTQGKTSSYDTDVFQTIIKEIAAITGLTYGKKNDSDIAMRVVADHLRAVSFSIADGQMPSNNKAGYVIRRILRRAIRYGYTYLSCNDPFIYKLVPVLINIMGDTFSELSHQEKHITQVILQEEKTFLNTLGKGIKLIEKKLTELKKSKNRIFNGSDAFTLYDTYGFPLDLTQLILKENKIEVDIAAFEQEMKKQRDRSRADAIKETEEWIILKDDTSFVFTGYEDTTGNIEITKYRKVRTKGKDIYQLVFNSSPFYAESGGQAGDTGYIFNDSEKIPVTDTIKENNLNLHITHKIPVEPKAGFTAIADRQKRHYTAYNHSATHLLHYALREVLGTHVEQKGSLVNHEKLRFDFSHFQKLTPGELKNIEKLVNSMIREDLSADILNNISMEEALDKGAIALFGEKYDNRVRVITFGKSVELCGGTHVKSTGNIGLFKIISESGVAAGVRRIEAITSATAFEYLGNKLDTLEKIKELVGPAGNLPDAVSRLISENSTLKKTVEQLEAEAALIFKTQLMERSEVINGITVVTGHIKATSVDMLKSIASRVRETGESVLFAAGTEQNGKANLVVMVSDDLIRDRKLNAGTIIREAAREINGGGGGQPFLATAGGNNPEGIGAALKKIKEIVNNL